ncbi:hypothetical protein B0T18DRAFT_333599 [Schizothecium vesticola]|uniref:Uncharacterized protein n=1 Tax=Schizothecium vesticola TaxID=314040 RepID=A0AA40EHC5_9PEZI|nr:hypothetical protein B0T18DRAFT_333599 [Schizothecium vesticola]
MGQNLSLNEDLKDTSGARLSEPDRVADIILGIMWAGSAYGIGMIYCAVALLSRWSGKDGERDANFFSVLAAFVLSVGWPLILIYLARSG